VPQQQPDEVTALRAAQEWARELPSAGNLRRREFIRWIKYSPEHLKAYLLLTALETELAGVQASTQIDLESALSQLSTTVATLPGRSKSSSPATSFEHTRALSNSRARALRMVAVTAGVALLIFGNWLKADNSK